MSGTWGSLRHAAGVVVLAIAALAFVPGMARAQFFGYSSGYGFPAGGYGIYGGYYGYGYPGFGYGYGYPGYGYGYSGIGYGYPGYGLGYSYGYATPGVGFGYGYGYPPGFAYGGSAFAYPYLNPLFGVGLSPLGVQSYVTESNWFGRGQIDADRRARIRDMQGRRR